MQASEIKDSNVISKDELRLLRKMSAEDFERSFEKQLKTEQHHGLRSIYFMKESYRRRDWSKTHSNFNRYCVQKMKMSDSDFYRKYSIMKTIEEIPEIEGKILDGSLNQSTVSKAIQFLNKEARFERRNIETEEKRELFLEIENMTEKEVEKEFSERLPEAAIPDKTKQISENGYLRQFTSDQSLEEKHQRLRELLAHTFQGHATECEFQHRLADIALEKLDPIKKDERKLKRDERKAQSIKRNETSPSLVKTCVTNREPIPAQLKRFVRLRDHYQCTYVNPKTNDDVVQDSHSSLITSDQLHTAEL